MIHKIQTLLPFFMVMIITMISHSLFAQEKSTGKIDLAGQVEFLEDPTSSFTIEDVKSRYAPDFQPWQKSGDVNMGFTESTYWFRFTLVNDSASVSGKRLLIPFIALQHITLYLPNQHIMQAGSNHPIENRAWPHRYFVFPIQLTTPTATYYLQVKTNTSMTVPLTLWDPDDFAIETQITYLQQGIYYGGLLALMIYNLLIFISLREKSFLLYAIFSATMGLAMVFGNGIGQQYLWSFALFGQWENQFTIGLYTLTLTTAIAFTRSFLETRQGFQRFDDALRIVFVASLIIGLLSFMITAEWISQLSSLAIMIGTFLVVTVGILSLRAGNHGAQYFVLSWGILCLGAFVSGLRNFDVVPTNIITANAVQISSAIEMLLLSFALAHRIRTEKEAKEKIQQQLVEILTQSEAHLEYLVKKRTDDLRESLRNEKNTLEKFLRFGAYISHEFRNSLAIIKNQLATLRKEKELGLVKNIDKRLNSIQTASERLGKLFESWLHHDRIRQGEYSLSRKELNLDVFITQLTQQSQILYPENTIICLPFENKMIYADPDMLKIALFNLIDNASKYSDKHTTIYIGCQLNEKSVIISIKDEGIGIDDLKQSQIFQDYFRIDTHTQHTEGMGLGLSFVKTIAELHQGYVVVNSKIGKGSTFFIDLPRIGVNSHE